MNKITQIKTTFEEQRNKAITEAKKAFSDICKEVFVENPEIKSFNWNQYTRYWCDGDPCSFTVHSDSESVKINGKTIDEDKEASKEYGSQPISEVLYCKISSILDSIGEEFAQNIFGDHCEITATPEGFTIEPYDHE